MCLRIGPACEAGLSAGMRKERVPPPKGEDQNVQIPGASMPAAPLSLTADFLVCHFAQHLSNNFHKFCRINCVTGVMLLLRFTGDYPEKTRSRRALIEYRQV